MGQSASSTCSSSSSSINPATTTSTNSSINGGADLTLLLPDDLIALTLSHLPSSADRNSASLVCRRWNSIDSASRRRLTLLARSDISPFLPHLLHHRFPNLSTLFLKCSRKLISLDDNSLYLIASSLPNLQKLKLKGCADVTDSGLHQFSISCSPLLKKFSCASCGFGAKGLNSIVSNCKALEDLSIKRLRKLDGNGDQIHKLDVENRLQRICLKDLHNGLVFESLIRASKRLKTLIICRTAGEWDRILENSAESLEELVELQMDNVLLGDTGLMAVSRCKNLEVLYLSRASDCSDFGISAVANGCRNLSKVHLDGCKFNRIGDNSLMAIATKCVELQEVVLMGVDVSSVGLNALAKNCLNLERMALCNTDSVGDMEMACVAERFGSLKKLCLKNCPVSDCGIEAIGWGCPNLVKLKVKRCKAVSKRSVCWLRLQRRGLVVSVDGGSAGNGDEDGEDGEEGGEGGDHGGRSMRFMSSATDLVCGSRGSMVFKSRFSDVTSAFMSRRRSSGGSVSFSSHDHHEHI